MESNLVIYNWSQYDDPSTYKSFKTKNNVAIKETYYSSNDELLAKLQAGGAGYDIIVPSQNAVGELVQLGSLMKLDKALIPNASARGVVLGEDGVRPDRRVQGGQGLRRHHVLLQPRDRHREAHRP